SHSEPRGSPDSSSNGVRCAGSLARNSGVVVCPQTSTSSKSSPAARTKMRTVRLFTLGLRMLSVFSAMCPPSVRVSCGTVVGQRRSRARDEQLDRIREVRLVDVVVAALDAQLVRLEEDVGVRVAEGRLESIRGELDQEPERVVEVDRVHEAAVLDAAVADLPL